MRVLLLKDVEGVGRAGDVKEVAGGYAQNYLLPRRLATPVTDGVLKQARSLQDASQRRQERKQAEAKALVERINGKTLRFTARAGEGDRLYGSVTSADIAEMLAKVAGIPIDRRAIDLEHPIKTLGEHKVAVKIGSGATASVYVRVEREAEV